MQIYYATTNKGKIESLQKHADGTDIQIVQCPLDIPEPRSDDVVEIARLKVSHAYSLLKAPVIALDAGFYINSLKGFPRTFVNFALDTIGIKGIMKLVEGKERSCEFRQCLAYMDGSLKEPICFIADIPGTIAASERGIRHDYQWSDLWLIFIPAGKTMTLAEMSKEEYDQWQRSLGKDSVSEKTIRWLVSRTQESQ